MPKEASVALADNAIAPAHKGAILGTGDDMLFGLFPVNAAHNVLHILFGLWGLMAARSWRGALIYARSIANHLSAPSHTWAVARVRWTNPGPVDQLLEPRRDSENHR